MAQSNSFAEITLVVQESSQRLFHLPPAQHGVKKSKSICSSSVHYIPRLLKKYLFVYST